MVVVRVLLLLVAEVLVLVFLVEVVHWIRQMLLSHVGVVVFLLDVHWIRQMQWL